MVDIDSFRGLMSTFSYARGSVILLLPMKKDFSNRTAFSFAFKRRLGRLLKTIILIPMMYHIEAVISSVPSFITIVVTEKSV